MTRENRDDARLAHQSTELVRLVPNGVVERGETTPTHAPRVVDVKVIEPVVHVEEPVHEVAADAKLRVRGIRVAHRGEQTSLQAMERVSLALREVSPTKQPFLALDSGLLSVAVIAKGKVAVRNQIRDEDLGRRRAEGRGTGDRGVVLHYAR